MQYHHTCVKHACYAAVWTGIILWFSERDTSAYVLTAMLPCFRHGCRMDCTIMHVSHHRHGQDKTVLSCPCRLCEQSWR